MFLGHGVLAIFILTNTLSITEKEKCPRCWSKRTVGQSDSFWPSVFYLLSQLSAFSYDPSKPMTLVPSPFQLPAGSQWGAAKWGGDYHFPQCFLDSWWLPLAESHETSCNHFLPFLSFCLGCKGGTLLAVWLVMVMALIQTKITTNYHFLIPNWWNGFMQMFTFHQPLRCIALNCNCYTT